jgi:hypothetical protein
LLDSKRNNQSEWLKVYKKECVQLNASLNNLTEKQLKKLSRLIQNRCRKLSSSYGLKDERSKAGGEIISLSENIKDEYKDTFWKLVYLYLVEKRSSDSFDNENYLGLFKSQNCKVKDKTFDDFIKRLIRIGISNPDSNPSLYISYYYNIYYDIDMSLHVFNNLLEILRIFFDLKTSSFVVDCKSSSVGDKQHLVALFDESSNRSQDRILTPEFPTNLKIIIFKAIIYEFVFPEQADKVWDELVSNQCFTNYLKFFSQKNIKNNLTTTDDYDFLDQIDNGYIPMMKELPVLELRRKYKDNI